MTQPTIRLTKAVIDNLRSQVTERRTSLQMQLKQKQTEKTELVTKLKAIDADISLINQQLSANLTEVLAISNLREGEYAVVGRFGDQKVITSLFSRPRDYVYVVASRSGGRSHTTRWDERDNKWRCDCESGINRGWCWVTRGVNSGVQLDFRKNPYITDENGRRHDVARFLRQV